MTNTKTSRFPLTTTLLTTADQMLADSVDEVAHRLTRGETALAAAAAEFILTR